LGYESLKGNEHPPRRGGAGRLGIEPATRRASDPTRLRRARRPHISNRTHPRYDAGANRHIRTATDRNSSEDREVEIHHAYLGNGCIGVHLVGQLLDHPVPDRRVMPCPALVEEFAKERVLTCRTPLRRARILLTIP